MTERILLCSIGKTPQIATETAHELMHDRKRPWVPTRIEIVTTSEGLKEITGRWAELAAALGALFPKGAPPVTFFAAHAGAVREPYKLVWKGGTADAPQFDETAALRPDIRSPEDAEAFGDLIKDRIWEAVRREDSELHVSIAGGRKTMSGQAHLALCLLGRAQDQASHVLIEPADFEDHPQFWHPRQGGKINTKAEANARRFGGKPLPAPSLDPRDAKVSLIRLPAPLVSEMKPDRETLGALRFSQIVRQIELANAFRVRPSLIFDDGKNTVTLCGQEEKLSVVNYVKLRFCAEAMLQGVTEKIPKPGARKGWVTAAMLRDGLGETMLAPIAKTAWLMADKDSDDRGEEDNKRRNMLEVMDQDMIAAPRRIKKGLVKDKEVGKVDKKILGWFDGYHLKGHRIDLAKIIGVFAVNLLLPEPGTGAWPKKAFGLGCGPGAITIKK